MIRHTLFTVIICSETLCSGTFTIASSFGGAWWFIMLIFGLIMGILVYIYYYKRKQEIAIERMRSQIATDLHDDIGSTLSGIAIFSEMGCRETGEISPKASGLFRRIGESSLSILDALDDIVWAINPENDSLRPLIIRMQDFATGILEAKQITYNINIPSRSQDIKLSMIGRKNIYLIFKEGIHNLVKHSGCNQASIGIDINNNSIRFHIEDDGIGFDPSTVRNGNGLNNMRRRAEYIGASISIKSAPGNGTNITVQIEVT